MNATQFRDELERDGYAIREVQWAPNTINPEHTHPFSARLLCLSGEIHIDTPEGPITCKAGDQCSLAANIPHTERVGPDGVQLLVGRKTD